MNRRTSLPLIISPPRSSTISASSAFPSLQGEDASPWMRRLSCPRLSPDCGPRTGKFFSITGMIFAFFMNSSEPGRRGRLQCLCRTHSEWKGGILTTTPIRSTAVKTRLRTVTASGILFMSLILPSACACVEKPETDVESARTILETKPGIP